MNNSQQSKITKLSTGVNIGFIGDLMLGERFEKLNRGVISKFKSGVDPFKESSKQLLLNDLNIANLECVVSSHSDRSDPFSKFMIIPPDILTLLTNNNVKIVNIANNHIFDHGEKAFFETMENLEKFNIDYFGFDRNGDIQKDPLEISLKGKTIGILGYDLSNYSRENFDKRINEIYEIICSIEKGYDLLILSLHWGYEYSDSPTSYMIKSAELFFNAGIDLIYGHHPHILHGITFLEGKIFVPSLGNFIFDDERERNRFTGILNIELKETNDLNFKFLPYYSNENMPPFRIIHNSIIKGKISFKGFTNILI
jgi:poly-gamma-glutamate synthesis protein (capsule biosynthesis protein)